MDVITLDDNDGPQSASISLLKDDDTSSGLGSESDESQSAYSSWRKGDRCLAEYPPEGSFYEARIKRIFRNKRNRKMALVSFRGYPSDDDEDVLCSSLKPLEKERQPSKCLFQQEEEERLRNKFLLLEEEEALERASQRVAMQKKEELWKSTTKRLIDSPSRDTPARTRKRKTAVAIGGGTKASSSQKTPRNGQSRQRSPWSPDIDGSSPRNGTNTRNTTNDKDSHKETEDTPAMLDSVTEPTKARERRRKIVQHTGLTSESESDEEAKGRRSGFDDEDLEKPKFSHITPGPKEPFVLSEEGVRPVVQVPSTINQYLRDYQRDGIRFLYSHFKANHGALLGDDMGLGKTVQVIGFIAAILRKTGTKIDVMKQKPLFIRKMSSCCLDEEGLEDDDDSGPKKPFLIIGPASVLYNWVDELDTWGHFTVGKFHRNYKEQTLADLRKNKLDIVVTTFETCRDNVAQLNKFNWEAVFADEAHKIKGLKAEVSRALRKLKCLKRYGLTGTPLQNNLEEMWCLLDWANPGCLDNLKSFKDNFVKKVEKGQKQDATKRELADARKAQEKLAQLREKWLLRRTKQLISDQLPGIQESVVFCKPTELQTDIYKTILAQDDMKFILTQKNPCECGSGRTRIRCHHKKTPSGELVQTLTMSYLHMCLKTANHIALLLPEKTSSEKQQQYAARVTKQVFERHPQFLEQTKEASFRTLSDPKYCGKMKVLQGLLSVFKKERAKVLLFSYSTMLLDIIETHVMCKGYEYRRLDGSTPGHKRVGLVKEFNNNPGLFLFLASTKAGGIGLNLTGANVVIIFDPNWNPTHDLQAQDRAYRIGQRRNVRVFRLICSGTIEENVYLRQIYKQQLGNVAVSDHNAKRYFQGIQGDQKNKGELFGVENMFFVRTGDRCLTEDILKRHDKIEAGLRAFNIAKYVPSSSQEGGSEETEDTEGDSGHDDSDGEPPAETGNHKRPLSRRPSVTAKEKDDYGASYICTQMFGLDYEDDDLADKSPMKKLKVQNSDSDSDATHRHRTRARRKQVSFNSDSDLEDRRGESRSRSDPCQCQECCNPQPSTSTYKQGKLCSRTRSKKSPSQSRRKGRQKLQEGSNISDSEDSAVENKARSKVRFQTEAATFGSITDVFDQCGVVHMHQNRKITGASRAEDHMSRCAVQDVYELHQYSQMPAVNCQPFSESSEESDPERSPPKSRQRKGKTGQKSSTKAKTARNTKKRKPPPAGPRMQVIDNKKVLIGQTPRGIRRVQFNSLAAFQNEQTPANLAIRILHSSPEQRLHLLRTFYGNQDSSLKDIFPDPLEEDEDEREDPGGKTTSKRGKKTNKRTPNTSRKTSSSQRKRSATKRGCHFEENTDSEAEEQQNEKVKQRSKPRRTLKEKSSRAKQPSTATDDGDDVMDLLTDITAKEGERMSSLTEVVDPDISNLLDEIEAIGSSDSRSRMPQYTSEKKARFADTPQTQKKNRQICDTSNESPVSEKKDKVEESFAFLDDIFFDDIVKRKSPAKKDNAEKKKLKPPVNLTGERKSDSRSTKGSTKGSIVDVDDLMNLL